MSREVEQMAPRWNIAAAAQAGYHIERRSRLSWSVSKAGKELGKIRASVSAEAYPIYAGRMRATNAAEVAIFKFKPVGALVHRPSSTAAAIKAKFGNLPTWTHHQNANAAARGDLLWACQHLEALSKQKNSQS